MGMVRCGVKGNWAGVFVLCGMVGLMLFELCLFKSPHGRYVHEYSLKTLALNVSAR